MANGSCVTVLSRNYDWKECIFVSWKMIKQNKAQSLAEILFGIISICGKQEAGNIDELSLPSLSEYLTKTYCKLGWFELGSSE